MTSAGPIRVLPLVSLVSSGGKLVGGSGKKNLPGWILHIAETGHQLTDLLSQGLALQRSFLLVGQIINILFSDHLLQQGQE